MIPTLIAQTLLKTAQPSSKKKQIQLQKNPPHKSKIQLEYGHNHVNLPPPNHHPTRPPPWIPPPDTETPAPPRDPWPPPPRPAPRGSPRPAGAARSAPRGWNAPPRCPGLGRNIEKGGRIVVGTGDTALEKGEVVLKLSGFLQRLQSAEEKWSV